MPLFNLSLLARIACAACLVSLCACDGPTEKAVADNPFTRIKAGNTIDSMRAVLKIAGEDTFRAYALSRLCWSLRRDDPDTALLLGKQALALSEKLQWKKGQAEANHNLAVVQRTLGNYRKALDHNYAALDFAREMNDSARIGSTLGNLGSVYYTQGDYPKALEHYLAALKIAESRNEKQRIATQLGNIGSVYLLQEDHRQAISHYRKALKIDRENHDTAGIAFDLGGIGGAYIQRIMPDSALVYYRQAAECEKNAGSKYSNARVLGNIGICWSQLGDSADTPAERMADYDSALYYYRQSYDIAEEIGDKRGKAINMSNIGRMHLDLGKYADAEKIILAASALCDSIGIPATQKDAELNLYVIYDTLHDYKKALRHYMNYVSLRDSLVNEDKSKEILRDQMNFEFEKKSAVDQAKANEELARQKVIRNGFFAGGLLLLVIAAISLRAYRMKKRSGEIIARQKMEVENQKLLVEEKQQEIIDSINYAKRIQSAILPTETEIENQFRESFVLFLPKDIVSGDFYWMAKTKEFTFIAAVDCTGHGVPGGFMSMLGNSLLNEIVLEKQITDPGEILDLLRLKIIGALKQKGEAGENKDGMDMALCRFSNDFTRVVFSCANNPLWICRGDKMMEFRPDKQPVGISGSEKILQFTTQEERLLQGDCVYLFTDGYADQFGGEKGKKFKYKPLKELLISNRGLEMKAQKEVVTKAFADWKGSLEQVDDVLLIGIKIR